MLLTGQALSFMKFWGHKKKLNAVVPEPGGLAMTCGLLGMDYEGFGHVFHPFHVALRIG